jgi:Uma2 family endonuclease
MDWQQVLADPTLANLPYKIELNEWGNIEMTPASNRHRAFQASILILLRSLMTEGKSYVEMSIDTAKNVKVADVIWASEAFLAQHGFETPYRLAPEICVEIVSPANSQAEMMTKKDLYLAKGAKEVWFCEDGQMRFYDHQGKCDVSTLCPAFPLTVEP